MHGMCLFKRGDLPEPDQGSRMFCLVPERVDDLVEFYREIGMGTHPEGIHRIDSSLTRRPESKFHIKRTCSSVGYPVYLFFKSLDVFCLFHELLFRNEKREEGLFVIPVHEIPENSIYSFPDTESEREPDVQPFHRVSYIHDLRTPEDVVVPL